MTGLYMDNQTTSQIIIEPVQKAEIILDAKPVVTDLGHAKLLSGLYFIHDAMHRAMLHFFLVKQTAREAIARKQLSGDHIDIGVRNNEWANDSKDILFSFFDNEHVTKISELPDQITFSWQDVPFTIHLYDDCEPLMALIPITYEYESWDIPNQFERFEREFDK